MQADAGRPPERLEVVAQAPVHQRTGNAKLKRTGGLCTAPDRP
jgi:hypothetical protein